MGDTCNSGDTRDSSHEKYPVKSALIKHQVEMDGERRIQAKIMLAVGPMNW
jgi:hypothetical protein